MGRSLLLTVPKGPHCTKNTTAMQNIVSYYVVVFSHYGPQTYYGQDASYKGKNA